MFQTPAVIKPYHLTRSRKTLTHESWTWILSWKTVLSHQNWANIQVSPQIIAKENLRCKMKSAKTLWMHIAHRLTKSSTRPASVLLTTTHSVHLPRKPYRKMNSRVIQVRILWVNSHSISPNRHQELQVVSLTNPKSMKKTNQMINVI